MVLHSYRLNASLWLILVQIKIDLPHDYVLELKMSFMCVIENEYETEIRFHLLTIVCTNQNKYGNGQIPQHDDFRYRIYMNYSHTELWRCFEIYLCLATSKLQMLMRRANQQPLSRCKT